MVTSNEFRLFRCLQELAGSNYYVAPQVGGLGLMRPKWGLSASNQQRHVRAASPKRIDFAWCSRGLDILGVIELDDPTHDVPDRKKKDNALDAMLRSAGLPIVRIQQASFYDQATIAELIATKFGCQLSVAPTRARYAPKA